MIMWNTITTHKKPPALVNRQKNSKLPRVTFLSLLWLSLSLPRGPSAIRDNIKNKKVKKNIAKSVLKAHSDFLLNMKAEKISSGLFAVELVCKKKERNRCLQFPSSSVPVYCDGHVFPSSIRIQPVAIFIFFYFYSFPVSQDNPFRSKIVDMENELWSTVGGLL